MNIIEQRSAGLSPTSTVRAVLIGLAVVLLAACGPFPGVGEPSPTDTGPTTDPQAVADAYLTTATPIRTITTTAATDPVLYHGILVSYIVQDDQLKLRAWEARTGTTLWTKPASPGGSRDRDSYLWLGLVQIGGRTWVPHLESDGFHRDRVVATDIRTGETVKAGRQIDAQSLAYTCEDGMLICVTGVLVGGSVTATYTFDPTTKVFIMQEGSVLPGAKSGQIQGIYRTEVPGCNPPPMLDSCGAISYAVDGVTRWSVPWATVIGPNSSWSWGYSILTRRDSNVAVISGYSKEFDRVAGSPGRGTSIRNLAEDRVVGLAKSDGHVVWEYRGARYDSYDEDTGDLFLDVVDSGRVIAKDDDWDKRRLEDFAGMRMIRVRYEDGALLGEQPIDRPAVEDLDTDPQFARSGGSVFVHLGEGLELVDMAEGTTSPLPEEGRYPCSTTLWRHFVNPSAGVRTAEGHWGGSTHWSCRSDGRARSATWSVGAVDLIGDHGTEDDRLVVVLTDTALLVFELPDK